MKFGIHEETLTLCFPISVNLTEDKSIGGLTLKIHDWENILTQGEYKKMGFDFETHETSYNEQYRCLTGKRQRFIVGEPRFCREEDDIALIPMETGRKDLIGFSPAIVIKGHPEETFFI